jgi:hypothetical protein
MYQIFPYLEYNVTSGYEFDVILKRFSDFVCVTNKISRRDPKTVKSFVGVILHNGFTFRRIMKVGYSAFLPYIQCVRIETDKGNTFKVTVKFPRYINIGLIIFFLLELPFLFYDVNAVWLALVEYVVILFVYNFETKILINRFEEILSPKSDDG